MTLWLALTLMTAAAILVVLWPLSRSRVAHASGSDLAVYKDQIGEIARDRAAGLIGEAEAAAARVEISRRLLAAADSASADPAGMSVPWRRRLVAITALLALPIGAGGLYFALGSPGLPDQPLAARLDSPVEQRSIEALVSQVERHLELNPQDGRGWEMIAPVYLRLGRFDDAVKARTSAVRLLGDSADREADLGEALAAAANGIVTVEAKTAFDRAIALDPNNLKGRYYAGLAAEQDGKPQDAAGRWRDMLAQAPAGAPWAELVRQSLARVEPTSVSEPSGPTPNEMAAAAELSPEQRSDMVRGMVERLAARLQRDGSDAEGWLRLVRAYVVLGQRDEAQSAAAAARRALAADPEKVRRIDALVKDLGLEG
ncbi:MAG: c-type cytochrome biogenesis protein CcmI [Alphaproteobacteria bacterium]|nr:MAG: c-type cytochrome biogenesis protein CcmI [Alphaproteobacteria bacterium]